MRFATWNINGVRARLEYVKAWLKERQPDVVGFQELKAEDDLFPTEEFEALGYHCLTHGQKSWNGVAILSKEPVELRQKGLPGHHDFGARFLAVKCHDDTEFITMYCPNGKTRTHADFERKLAWYDGLRTFLSDTYRPESPIVLCGDFNIVPEPIDTWREDTSVIFHTDEEREKIDDLMSFGLYDAYRMQNPNNAGYSWWDYRAGAFQKDRGLRIDLMLVSSPIRKRVQAAFSDKRWREERFALTPSDHCPVYIDVE